MPLKIELKGASPGFADLVVTGSGSDPGQLKVALQRNQDEQYLALEGSWQATPCWHELGEPNEAPDGFIARVGPEIVDSLIGSAGMMFLAYIRSDRLNSQQVVKVTGRLLGSSAAGTGQADSPLPTSSSEEVAEPEPLITPMVNEPGAPDPTGSPDSAVKPAPPPPKPKPKPKPKIILWVFLALFLALAAAAAWYFLQYGNSSDLPAEPDVDSLPTESDPNIELPETQPIDPDTPVATPSEQSEVELPGEPVLTGRARAQAFMNTSPSPTPKAMLEKATEWESEDDCEAAIIVMNSAAVLDGEASKALAERYDPANFQERGCIRTADEETAIYWYEQPAELGDQTAQSRLGLLLTERNKSGPLYDKGLVYLRKAAESGDSLAEERLSKLGEEP